MSHHMVLRCEEGTLGRIYRARVEFDDGSTLGRNVTISHHDLEVPGRARHAVAWSLKCDLRRHISDADDVVEKAIDALVEADPEAFP